MFGLKPPLRLLFVCTENTCRSPVAEALARQQLAALGLDRRLRAGSAGTSVSRPGRRPDARALRLLAQAGAGTRGLRARQLGAIDIVRSEHVLAMDSGHMEALLGICPPGHEHKVRLLLGHDAQGRAAEVPDPYYGSVEAFQQVFQLLQEGVAQLLQQLRALETDSPR